MTTQPANPLTHPPPADSWHTFAKASDLRPLPSAQGSFFPRVPRSIATAAPGHPAGGRARLGRQSNGRLVTRMVSARPKRSG
jgi:hypothetical protein